MGLTNGMYGLPSCMVSPPACRRARITSGVRPCDASAIFRVGGSRLRDGTRARARAAARDGAARTANGAAVRPRRPPPPLCSMLKYTIGITPE